MITMVELGYIGLTVLPVVIVGLIVWLAITLAQMDNP